ncbi:MAG TPA: RidA family protein [Solirubrobacterales bacterium]|nr:RidA family protein [Solirubrobacterales bacterium]
MIRPADKQVVGPGPLMSDAIRWGDLLFLSGRAAVDPATGKPRGEDFASQCRVVLEDVGAVLAAGGSDFGHVLRVECWLADAADFPAWNEFFTATFAQPRPARTTTIGQLPLPGLLVELQVTAGVPS